MKMRNPPSPRLNRERDLHLRKEGLILPIVSARIKPQTPSHSAPLVLYQRREDLGQRGTFRGAPVVDAAIAIGECGHGRGGAEGFYKRQGDGEVGCWDAGGEVEDMAGYGVAGGKGGGVGGGGNGVGGVRHGVEKVEDVDGKRRVSWPPYLSGVEGF